LASSLLLLLLPPEPGKACGHYYLVSRGGDHGYQERPVAQNIGVSINDNKRLQVDVPIELNLQLCLEFI